jgi:exopolyphosphatase/guanosine-5'-triphosphate,3'-diphosphate pyrophosphatase
MLGWSALLHEIGLQVNSRGIQKHSGYILSNSDLPGFNQDQQRVMASLVRFHRKKIIATELPTSIEYTEICIIRMLSILRLGILLNMNRQVSNDILNSCRATDDTLELMFNDKALASNALLTADIEKERQYLKQIEIKLSAT